MKGLSFFWKVFGATVVVVLMTALIVYFTALSGIERRIESSLKDRVTEETELVAELALLAWSTSEHSFDLQAIARAAAALESDRVTLIASDGVVLFDSHESPAAMDNHSGRWEVQHLGQVVTRHSRTLGKQMTYCAMAVDIAGERRAFARVAISSTEREARLAGLRDAIGDGALLAGLASLLLAGLLARRVTRPLSQIAGLVAEVGRGGTTRRLHVESHDEVGQLATAVNRMARDLHEKMGRIKRDKAEREAILSAMTDGLLALDLESRTLLINQSASDLLNVTDVDPKGVPVAELNRNPQLGELIEMSASSVELQQSRARLLTAAGERIVEMSAAPLAGVGGDRRGTLLVLRDVTELNRLEAVRRDFVSNVSHELKTPLTAMRGFLEAVLENDEMPGSQRQAFLSKAQRNTERLSAIVTDLLSLSRLESEEHELCMEPMAIEDLVHETIEELGDLALSRKIEIELSLASEPLLSLIDAQAMVLALTNLIANAIRYSPEGSNVRVTTQGTADEVRIDVSDDGPGIAEHEQDRIFERFYRIDKARSRVLGGTGLGLAIVRHVMAAHGGRVELQSEIGRGSTFSLVLPRSEA